MASIFSSRVENFLDFLLLHTSLVVAILMSLENYPIIREHVQKKLMFKDATCI